MRPSLLLPQACGNQSLNVAPSPGTALKSHYVFIGESPRGHPPRGSNYAKYCAWQVVCHNILWSEASRRPAAAAPAKLSAWKKRKPKFIAAARVCAAHCAAQSARRRFATVKDPPLMQLALRAKVMQPTVSGNVSGNSWKTAHEFTTHQHGANRVCKFRDRHARGRLFLVS